MIALVSAVSWLAAVSAYVAVIYLKTGRLFVGDTESIFFLGGIVLAITVPLLYLPVLNALRGRVRASWPFPVAGALLGIAPLILFAMLLGGRPRDIFSEPGAIISLVFAVFGAVFGAGYNLTRKGQRAQ